MRNPCPSPTTRLGGKQSMRNTHLPGIKRKKRDREKTTQSEKKIAGYQTPTRKKTKISSHKFVILFFAAFFFNTTLFIGL